MMTDSESWYIVKQADGHCEIIPGAQLGDESDDATRSDRWGPFASLNEAIGRRVGLIRAGKCQPN